jgi:hypothetical protein
MTAAPSVAFVRNMLESCENRGMKARRLEGTHDMTITEIVLTGSEFQTLVDTLEAGIKQMEEEENHPDEQRHRGITLTGILKKMAAPNASYVLRCTVSEPVQDTSVGRSSAIC